MSEPKTWEITSPEDVDVFERETAEAHEAEERHGYTERPGACGVVLYIRNDLPPLFESSREDFLEHARETARQEPLEIHAFVMTDGTRDRLRECWATTPGCCCPDLGWDVLRECWTPCGDERDPDCPRHGTGDGEAVDENAPETPKRRHPRPVFSYLKWSVRNPGERYRTEWRHPEPHTTGLICPEPDCLRERKGLERTRGWEKDRVVETGEHGEVTLIALPCSQHEDTFSFQEDWPDGWYERFAGAFYAQQPAQQPMTCERCGRRYTSYLWGRAWDWCPACTYQEIREDEARDLRTNTMELGRRLGLGWKGTEYIGLPLDEREKQLESLLAFIQKSNRDWHAAAGTPTHPAARSSAPPPRTAPAPALPRPPSTSPSSHLPRSSPPSG